MKIGICCYPSAGGSGVVATELGIELAARGHSVHFISYRRPFRLDRLYPGLFFHQVEVSEYPLFEYPPYSLALASKIVDVAQHAGLDLIHAHYAVPHAVSAWMASEMLGKSLPTVTTLHGTDITLVGQTQGYLPVTQFALRHAGALTAVSDFLAEETRQVFGSDLNIQRIYNFVDIKRFAPRQNQELRSRFAAADEALLLHVSNFRPVKQVHRVIEAFAHLHKRKPARLLLAGMGPERNQMKMLTQQLGVEDRVAFLGNQETVTDLMSIADLFLLPSTTESFGLAALEAMSCGVPVIASRVGGLPELIQEGENGYLCNPTDSQEFAEASLQLLADSELYHRISRAARRTAEERFTIPRILPQYLDLYKSML